MERNFIIIALFSIVASVYGAPTANEDYVDRQDAQTYTNAVNAAKAHTADATNAVLIAAKAHTSAAVSSKIDAQAATNAANAVVSNVVDKAFVKALGVESDVSSVNGKTGAVTIAAADVGAVPTSRTVNGKTLSSDVTLTASDVSAVPTSRKINGQPLTGDITIAGGVESVNGYTGAVSLNASDVGAVPTSRKVNGYTLTGDVTIDIGVASVNGKTGTANLTASDVGAVPTSRKVNGKALSSDVSLTASDVSAVPTSRTVNGKPLSSDVTLTASDVSAVPTSRKINGQPLTGDITIAGGVTSVNSKTGAVSLTASDVGAFPNSSGVTLSGNVAILSNYIGGEDARGVVTNYNEGASDIPHFYLEYKTQEGNWIKVWDEVTRWNLFLPPYVAFTNAVDASIASLNANKADRAFGFYDSHTGGVSPDGFLSLSSSSIIIAKDMAYQKTLTTDGEAWILTANEPMTITGVTSNGFFKITDGNGQALFEIVKGDKRTVPATVGATTTTEVLGITHLHITFSVVSDSHPKIEICTGLESANWYSEDSASCQANVSWTGSSGAWVAEVWGKSALPKMFVKGTYQVGGDTYIKNSAPVGFSQIVIGGITYNVTVETINGKKLMVLTEAL